MQEGGAGQYVEVDLPGGGKGQLAAGHLSDHPAAAQALWEVMSSGITLGPLLVLERLQVPPSRPPLAVRMPSCSGRDTHATMFNHKLVVFSPLQGHWSASCGSSMIVPCEVTCPFKIYVFRIRVFPKPVELKYSALAENWSGEAESEEQPAVGGGRRGAALRHCRCTRVGAAARLRCVIDPGCRLHQVLS